MAGAGPAHEFAAAKRVFATAEDGALAWRLQEGEWEGTKTGNQVGDCDNDFYTQSLQT